MHGAHASIHDSRRVALHGAQRAAAGRLVRSAHMRRGRLADRLGRRWPMARLVVPERRQRGGRRRPAAALVVAQTARAHERVRDRGAGERAVLAARVRGGAGGVGGAQGAVHVAPRGWGGPGRARRGGEVRAHGVQRALLGHDGAETLDEL